MFDSSANSLTGLPYVEEDFAYLAKAIYDFNEDWQFKLKKDEILIVLDPLAATWIVRNKESNVGFVAPRYLVLLLE